MLSPFLLSSVISGLFSAPNSGPPVLSTDDNTTQHPPTHALSVDVGARVVLRPEARANTEFMPGPGDTQWRIRQGARLNTAMRYGPMGLIFQVQDLRDWGDDGSTISSDTGVGVHQAFVEVAGESFGRKDKLAGFLRLGRQESPLWTMRLLGVSPWNPASRAFDAARGRLEIGRFGVEAGAAILRSAHAFTLPFGDFQESYSTSGEQIFWLETTFAASEAFNAHAVNLLLRQDISEDEPTRNRLISTPGIYLHGEPLKGLRYDLDAYGQFGTDGSLPHRAFAGWAAVGYTASRGTKPGVRLAYEIASGSACTSAPGSEEGCGEAVIRNFEQLYGSRHLWRGFADQFGLSNVRDLHIRGTLAPEESVQFMLDYHLFQLHEAHGYWMNTSGNLVGDGWDPTNPDNTIGHEIDLLVDYRPLDGLRVRPAYSIFVPAQAGRRLAGPATQHFVYIWLVAQIGHRFELGRR